MRTVQIDAVLFEREPGNWVAQCLQFDIGAEAKTLPELLYELPKALVGHIVIATENGVEPFEILPPAPQEYWEKWNQAKDSIPAKKQPFRMPKEAPSLPEISYRLAA
jgi:hypothetical protein